VRFRFLRFEVLASVIVALAIGLFAVGWLTREDPAEKPFLNILGGGFIFNYRVADAYYGFTAQVQKPLTSGSIIEAEFENPQGGDPFVVSVRTNARTTRYALRSPNLRGVKAGQPYRVAIRVYDFRHEQLIESHERTYTSQLSSEIVPEKPLTVGPGYHRNPDAEGQ
jgi:hypothetical protein